MNYYSTNDKNLNISFKQAVLSGIAEDGGLYMPQAIPGLPKSFIDELANLSFQEIAFTVAQQFADEIPTGALQNIIEKTITFDAPLVSLSENLFVLELFHGPTLAFKDFGARFLANTLQYFTKDNLKETVILVATSGDTGSAVANAFLGMEGIRVGLLYPSGKVSKIQEQQLTTMGGNVQAFEIDGTFDDCQALVKKAFADKDLKEQMFLTSANSINVARFLPQAFYYFRAFAQLKDKKRPLVFNVPSGNFGNLTAGLFAVKMGLPVQGFQASLNSNRFFADFIEFQKAEPRPSLLTLSNAMDVGNPSNFARILDLYENNHNNIKSYIQTTSINDADTLKAIKEVYEKYNYIIDPHGAVGYEAWKRLNTNDNYQTVILETAHPAKFRDTVKKAIQQEIEIPERLAACLTKQKSALSVSSDYSAFKETLISII